MCEISLVKLIDSRKLMKQGAGVLAAVITWKNGSVEQITLSGSMFRLKQYKSGNYFVGD